MILERQKYIKSDLVHIWLTEQKFNLTMKILNYCFMGWNEKCSLRKRCNFNPESTETTFEVLNSWIRTKSGIVIGF